MTTKLTIIIPTYNEEDVIENTLRSIDKEVKTPHQILVVDDSTDNTEKVVRKYSKRNKNVKFVKNNPKKKGFSQSLKTALKHVETDVVVVVMGDMCDDPKLLDKMYEGIQKGADVVCGSRYMKGGKKIGGPKLQGLFSMLVCKSLYLITGVPTVDASNAFKMYKKKVLKDVVFNPLSGVESSMETFFQVYFNDGKIVEIPTVWRGRTVGESKFNFFKRTPQYMRIYLWVIENSLRKSFHLKLKSFYVK